MAAGAVATGARAFTASLGMVEMSRRQLVALIRQSKRLENEIGSFTQGDCAEAAVAGRFLFKPGA